MRAAGVTSAVLALAVAVTLAGCPSDQFVRAQESPFEPCPPPAVAGSQPAATGTEQPLPLVALPCFTGGQRVQLTRLGRPAVINLWASWCRPCRAELPELQRFAKASGNKVVVLGVVTGDTREKAVSAAEDFGITFPALFDPDQVLRRGLGRTGLPMTLFVDGHGRLRHVYQSSELLTLSSLEDLTRQHLGVVVS
jgi:thiol-disulfide isomerase/thioredoxin